jgi:hypothetical protein
MSKSKLPNGNTISNGHLWADPRNGSPKKLTVPKLAHGAVRQPHEYLAHETAVKKGVLRIGATIDFDLSNEPAARIRMKATNIRVRE